MCKRGFGLLAAGLVLALVASGCVGYQLGSMLPPDIQTVHIPTFVNDTEEPLIEVEATRAAVRAIQRDGSLRLAGEETADAVLLVTLTDFRLQPLAFGLERRAAAEEYRMYLTATYELQRRTTGEVIVGSPRIRGESTFFFTGDLTSAKLDALPEAAEDLGRQIITEAVEMW